MSRKILPDSVAVLILLLLPLLLFGPVALGERTMLPADALFLFEPYRTAAAELGVQAPHNHLVTDLILENYAWKRFILEALSARQLPLWDPYLFAGHPFLANGQHSALYPLSIVFYLLPLWRAYGVFAWLQLGLAGVFTYLLVRVLRVRRVGALIAGITFQLCGFMAISVSVHPMIVAGASWLPFILAMVELLIEQRPALGRRPATLPWALLGAVGLGCQMLAGHAENTYFVLLVTGAYVAWRLGGRLAGQAQGVTGWAARLTLWRRPLLWLALMMALGLALGAVQFLPLYEVVNGSFRSGEAAASLSQVLGWAYPPRRLIAFAIPNFFGGPTQHGYFDLFAWRWVQAPTFPDGQYLDWGIKNYVEGAAYLGLLPLFLAAIACLSAWPARRGRTTTTSSFAGALWSRVRRWFRTPYIPFFVLLAGFSVGCVFGTPLYALVYALPGLEQSHSPFRWVFPLSLSVAVLAGFGVQAVTESRQRYLPKASDRPVTRPARSPIVNAFFLATSPCLVVWMAAVAFWGGVLTLVGLLLSRLFFSPLEPLLTRIFLSLAKAPQAFPNVRAFYAYEFRWAALFGLLLTGTGIVLRVSRCPIYYRRRPVWEFLAVGLLTMDLVSFGYGFNPAVDVALLDYVPPVVEFLRQDRSVWRYATFTPPGTTKTLNANVGMFYDLQCVAGYDSLFTRPYAGYMALIEPQNELPYNRIASFSTWSSLDSPLTDVLNVKYIITEVEIPNPKYRLVYQDRAVQVYENLAVMPRAYTLPFSATLAAGDLADVVREYDIRRYVVAAPDDGLAFPAAPRPATATPQTIDRYTINEVEVQVQLQKAPGAESATWLVLTDAYFPGWKAFLRPLDAGPEDEVELPVRRVNGVFRGVLLEAPGAYTVRFKYSPDSVKIGAFSTFIAGMAILFLTGIYLWRFFYREEDDVSTVRRVAKNSIAPIVLNLFNQVINFAFVALMARILGPVGTGQYETAVIVYGWFEIVANFGLDMYLMREVARDREHAWERFLDTTLLRLLLLVATLPLLVGFLAGRQALGTPLASETVWAVGLLYLGLLPGSIANGFAALFRGCEKHEYPAAIQTVTMIIRVTLGVLALAGGLGVVGIAGTAFLTNSVTLAILVMLANRFIWPALPRGHREARGWWLSATQAMPPMLAESWPLMMSLLLQALFPGVNALLLQYFHSDIAVGWYGAGRKWVDALNIVPAFFTIAVFPVVSRLATEDRAGLGRSYRLAVKLLVMVAFPVAMLVTLLATPLVGVLSGPQFLPQGAQILRILIWSTLFGWVNSLTNYVLIALDRQRYVLIASAGRVIFTIGVNLLFVGPFGYIASAWILVGGELLLVILFHIEIRRRLGAFDWGFLTGPLAAGLVMAVVGWAVARFHVSLALAASMVAYLGALILFRAFTPQEWALLSSLLPARLRNAMPAAWR